MNGDTKKALIIVDMVNGFIKEKTRDGPCALFIRGAESIVPAIKAEIAKLGPHDLLVFANDAHDPDDAEFKHWPPHCIVGTEETAVVSDLWDIERKRYTVSKTRYSAFYHTSLESILNYHNVTDVIICGVATDYCVFATALDASYRGYKITIPLEAVRPINPKQGAMLMAYLMDAAKVSVSI